MIDYNETKQKNLLSKITGKPVELNTIALYLIVGTLLTIMTMVAFFVMKRRAKTNKAQQLYARFLKKLKPYQLQPYPHETATDFAQRAGADLPAHQDQILKITALYNQLTYSRYSTISDNSFYTAFETRINAFNPKHGK